MCEAFGWKREDIPTKDRLLDVKYGWVPKGEKALYRRLSYMLRSPSPKRKEQGWKALEGLSDEELRLAIAHFDLRAKGMVIRWFGFLQGKEYKEICEEWGVDPQAWREEPDYGQCPYCGGELVFKEWAISSPGREPEPVIISDLVRVRGPGP